MPVPSLKRLLSRKPQVEDISAPDAVLIDGRSVAVRYRGNAKARRIIMRMEKDGHGIVLTLPSGTSKQAAHEFAVSQGAWIWQRLAPLDQPKSISEIEGTAIQIRGVAHEIRFLEGRGVPVHIRDLPVPQLMVRGETAHMQRRISDFLKRQARDDLERSSRYYAEAMGVAFKQLTVRDTTSRWGSCSSTGTLSYSWRLIMAPPKVLDYVCAHEVAHILEMNHGPDFWELVYRHCAHTDMARKWLRKSGHTLHKMPI